MEQHKRRRIDEDFSWVNLIKSNLRALTESTDISTGLVTSLIEKNLISDEEGELLMDERTPSSRRAMSLYTTTVKKWIDGDFEEFKMILFETANSRAFQILTNTPQNALLVKVSDKTQKEIEFLNKLKEKQHDGGVYECASLEEEETGKIIVGYSRASRVVMNGIIQLDGSLDKVEVIQQLKQFETALKKGHLWWNPQKPNLPSNYIERRVSRSSQFHSDGFLSSTAETTTLLQINEDLVLLVDPPGMGKSTEMTDLELKLRKKIPQNRIILRVNLNEVQKALSTISNENSTHLLFKLAPFVPPKTLQMEGIHLFVLLDGLDEVCPKHQTTMISLLRILRPASVNPSFQIKIFVTMRPHLRNPMESAFHVESFSLVPLEQEEQDTYIQAELELADEELTELRDSFEDSLVSLLTNPLMLFMLVDILKSPGSPFETNDLNMYDLYSRFISSKHQLHLVTKKRMREGDNYTDLEVESMLERNLRFYFHVAWNQLLKGSLEDPEGGLELPDAFFEWIGIVAEEPPSSGAVHTELLTFGLLMKNRDGRLVFKHRSFAEFFYASILFHSETPQEVSDTLFASIYGALNVLENVETFVAAASTKTHLRSNFHITPKWLLISSNSNARCIQFSAFEGGQLFSCLLSQVLMTFINGDPEDLLEAFRVLVDRRSSNAFLRVAQWLREDKEWSREHLFKMTHDESPRYSPSVARLIVAIEILFKAEDHLTEDEVTEAFKSCDNLLFTIASIQTDKRNKWDFLEKHFGTSKFKTLVEVANNSDLNILIQSDSETVWKLYTTFSRQELFSLVSKEETRMSDAVGFDPKSVQVALGEEFIPRKSQLAEFRGKFGSEEGKTVFELDGCNFALEISWKDFLKETEERNSEGPITVALREATARNGGSSELLHKLEDQVKRNTNCPRDSDEAICVMEWLVDGGSLWNNLTPFEFEILPFLLLYSSSSKHVAKLLQQNKSIKLKDESTLKCLLKSLVLSSYENHTQNFSQVKRFLGQNLRRIRPKWRSLAQTFSLARQEQLQSSLTLRRSLLLSSISVGQVFIALLGDSPTEQKFPWEEVVNDVIRSTRCCDLLATLSKLTTLLPEEKLREILLSDQVLFGWQTRFSYRNRNEDDYTCGLSGLLSFYFDVFGHNFDWMKPQSGPRGFTVQLFLLVGHPVEILTVLEEKWTHLVSQFEEMLGELLRIIVPALLETGGRFFYETEGEWERLLRMFPVEEESLQPASPKMEIPDATAVPFIRVLMKKFTLDANNMECLRTLLQNSTPNTTFSKDTLQSKATLLHILVKLEYLEQVERFTLPGLLLWKNSDGKNALDVAKEKLGDDHQITRHLQKHFNLL